MGQVKFLFLVVIVLVIGCDEFGYKRFTDEELTEQFEMLKGRMKPVEGYESTILSQKQIMPMYWTGCIAWDQQIYFCKDCKIKSVSRGQVARIFTSELGIFVMVKSGEYMTVYGRLDAVTLDKGDFIDRGTPIGQSSSLKICYFEIYRAGLKLDPSEWVEL